MKNRNPYYLKAVNGVVVMLAVLLLFAQSAFAIDNNAEVENSSGFATVDSYVDRYKHIAIEEMQNVGIPASIKLAQAILESSYGNSVLAIEANNHFGIKCGSSWAGLTVYADDDEANECFRKYRNSYESYIDHSQFLEKPRYAALFNIAITDYKSWAKGLQEAGYATNPNYARMLIEIIERHGLYKLDQANMNREVVLVTNTNGVSPVESSRQFKTEEVLQAATAVNRASESVRKASGRLVATEPLYYNGIKTIILESPVTPRQVEMLYGINSDKVCLYNNVQPNEVIPSNTKIYLQPMRNKSAKNMISHTAASGETMEEISQYYGIKLSKLYKRNNMREGTEPNPGQVIYLRGKAGSIPTFNEDYFYEEGQMVASHTETDVQKVVITEEPVRETTKTANPSTTSRDYYASSSSNTKTENRNSINYFNDETKNVASEEEGYSSYTPVKEKVKTVVNNVKEMVTGKDKESEPEVTTTYTRNNNGNVGGGSNVVVSKPSTSYYSSGTTTADSGSTTYVGNSNNYTYSGSTEATSNYYTEPAITTTRKVITTTSPATTTAATASSGTTYSNYTATSYPASQMIKHTVVKGDTLYNISKRNNTTVEEIKQLNGLYNNTIKLGQVLSVKTNTKF